MRKLTLSLDQLEVESYATDAGSADGGTVVGNSLPTLPFCTRFGCVSSECETVPCTLPQYFCPIPLTTDES
ncbi:MAG TPA: hypothetical protein VFR81_02350 [Longimicrobium sp.]|nr:hypothetical protein [Longimicrobium sp.]